jgi:hypothetical protein
VSVTIRARNGRGGCGDDAFDDGPCADPFTVRRSCRDVVVLVLR